jgi:NADH-quinone oxidoreductase subunit G
LVVSVTAKYFKLDDKAVAFEPGDTIIRAAERAGIDIPHYCWHPGLSIAANCRMCLVEMLPPPGRPAMMVDVVRYDPKAERYVKEKRPKLVPACQQPVAEGMEIRSDSSDFVKEARAAVQEFLLLNHPVDCPICDQAGECRLQDYWLLHQHEKKRMRDEPQHKPKAVVFGPTIVYDAERCIVCTRCIRFCEEVAKDPVLALRERGNLTEIMVAPGRQLDHDYTLMTEVVCPVGALTARDFRFKARVWFLRSAESICTGCSRGCNSYTDFDPRTQTVHRFRPRANPGVNKHWMCDEGMLSYRNIAEGRVLQAAIGGEVSSTEAAIEKAASLLRGVDGKKIAILLGAGFSLEDNAVLLWLGRRLGSESFFETGKPDGRADDILMQADKNPNTAGVQLLLDAHPLPIPELNQGLESGRFSHVLALGSSLKDTEAEQRLRESKGLGRVVLASHQGALSDGASVLLPVACAAEAEGSYVNVGGLVQVTEPAIRPAQGVCSGYRVLSMLAQALGHGPGVLTLKEVRAMLGASGSELAAGTEKLVTIEIPVSSSAKVHGWGSQLGPSSDQCGHPETQDSQTKAANQ